MIDVTKRDSIDKHVKHVETCQDIVGCCIGRVLL